MRTCHPLATLKYINSVISLPVNNNIKLRNKKMNWDLAILHTSVNHFDDSIHWTGLPMTG